MAWLNAWWQNEVLDGYKGPLLLSFVAFVVTFVTTRTITRLIRAGKGPFHNVSSGGVHMHHSTPGVVLLILGGFTAVGSPPLSVWRKLRVGVDIHRRRAGGDRRFAGARRVRDDLPATGRVLVAGGPAVCEHRHLSGC